MAAPISFRSLAFEAETPRMSEKMMRLIAENHLFVN
jgi:hypothetical protein